MTVQDRPVDYCMRSSQANVRYHDSSLHVTEIIVSTLAYHALLFQVGAVISDSMTSHLS